MPQINRLHNQSVFKSFLQYLLPSLIGMSLLSVNIVVDGIFVGHGVGEVALAAVNVASPVYSIVLSVALLIGVGGGTLYSIALGEQRLEHARMIYTMSFISVTLITISVTVFSLFFLEKISFLFGANKETLPYVVQYMQVILLFSVIMAWETILSIFVRNDGNPFLAMVSLVVTSLLNIVLNYWVIFVLQWGVRGAAIATITSIFIGLLLLKSHFWKKSSHLKLVKIPLSIKQVYQITVVGTPSFLSEIGLGIFVIGYNIVIVRYAMTNGLAAFSVINYLHSFMFLAFMGIGSAIQPMISYFHGAKMEDKKIAVVKIAERTALLIGISFFIGGYFTAPYLVLLFGITDPEIIKLATTGIRLFFISYLFMGINFIYIIYFQSIGAVRPSVWLTIIRSFIVFIIVLILLPLLLGINGVWLTLPVTEAVVMLIIVLFARGKVVKQAVNELN